MSAEALRLQVPAADASNMSTVLIPLVAAVLVLALVRVIDLLPSLVPTNWDQRDPSERDGQATQKGSAGR